MLRFCIAAALFVLSSAESVTETGKQCTWGPSFWCSNVKAAKDCGAVQFCIRNTWKQSSFVQDLHDDSTCTFCKKMVTDIRDYVTADQTEQAIIAYADKACAAISDKFISDECKGIANLYIVQIISMLKQNMDPTAVCRTINLCATADMFFTPTHYRPYLAISQNTLTRLAIDKLKTARIDDIIGVMANTTAKHSSQLRPSSLRSFAGSADDQCTTCTQGVEDLKMVFNNTNVRNEISDILKTNICPRFVLPGECRKLIDQYAPEIYNVMINLDPLAACETIGLCPVAEKAANQRPQQPIVPLAMIKPARQAAKRPVRNLEVEASVQCVLCEYVISTVMQALQDNTTDAKVIQVVTQVCNVMPSTVKAQCQQFISMYGQELIDLLTHSTDPQTICAVLGLCTGNQEQQQQPTTASPIRDVNLHDAVKAFMNIGPVLNGFAENNFETSTNGGDKKTEADNKCFMCRIVANYLISILNENYTAEGVQHALDKVCNYLPQKLSKECQMFVDKYTPQLMAVILSSLNTQTICQSLELCPLTPGVDQPNVNLGKEEMVVAPFAY